MSEPDSPLSLAFSPCPNDTFIFNALVHGRIDTGTLRFASPVLADVESLNEWSLAGRFDVTKLSFHALGQVLDRYALLGAGAALGRGCGPLLVARRPIAARELATCTIAIPGRLTTAALLLAMYASTSVNTRVLRFDRIMPAIVEGEVDAGVIIHESRFTYQAHGLSLLQDLGAWWEEETGLPIPLGGIVARRSLGAKRLGLIESAIRASLAAALADPFVGRDYIRRNAGELDEEVISKHIGLYVNQHSLELGEEGRAAVREFLLRGSRAGAFALPDGGVQDVESWTP